VEDNLKYLGVQFNNKKNCFATHKKNIIKRAERWANITYSVIAKSCNKIAIGKAFWKGLVLPTLLYGTEAMTFTKTEIQKLQRIENQVFRTILGAPTYTPCTVLRAEIGASLCKSRIMKQQILLYHYIYNTSKSDLSKKMITNMKENTSTFKWYKDLQKNCQELKIVEEENIKSLTKKEIKNLIRDWDSEQLHQALQSQSSLEIWSMFKGRVKEENEIYNNHPASITLFRARTNVLPLNGRTNFKGSKECVLCKFPNEDLLHFLIECPAYSFQRNQYKIFNTQNPQELMEYLLLFKESNQMSEYKNLLHNMWRERKRRLEELEE
jgi:hypothetical protein